MLADYITLWLMLDPVVAAWIYVVVAVAGVIGAASGIRAVGNWLYWRS
jgi:hypothetical protein